MAILAPVPVRKLERKDGNFKLKEKCEKKEKNFFLKHSTEMSSNCRQMCYAGSWKLYKGNNIRATKNYPLYIMGYAKGYS